MSAESAAGGGSGLTREDVLTAREVARILKLPQSTIYEYARRGIIPSAKIGKAVRFHRATIASLLVDD